MTVALDPATFEILRHRLWAINDEAATTIARVSGSPVASEAYDFNTALMTASGGVVMIGAYVMAHAAALDRVVEYVLAEYHENPGIGPGDMFMTNDPYVGAMHQPDVVVVAPIFVEGELLMWCGSVVHQTDVGGPVAGSVTAGASSIYEEAIPLAAVRMVEGGVIRKDLEREYLIRSRMPSLNALDMRGQIAANNVQVSRISALCRDYGTATVMAAVDRLITTTANRFRERLAELPDGRWHHVSYIEHDGLEDIVYEVALTMTKTGERLELDYTASSNQAPALINCTSGTLRGYSLAAVLTLLAYDLPWVPAALWPSITVRTRPGSIVDAQWPAGVSMGNSASGLAVRTCVNICVSKMLDEAGGGRAMASCMGSFAGQNISGQWDDGQRFGTMLLDSLAGGGGAHATGDGLDTSGMINAPAGSISNVETNELNYPLLYLWRRQLADSGGPGEYRGGSGGEHGYVVHHADAVDCTLFAHGVEQPTSAGLSGGEPGAPHGFLIVRGGRDLLARHTSDLEGEREVPAPKTMTSIGPTDVFVHRYAGGGGFGDPLDREPDAVALDVREGRVTPEGATRDFGVVVSGADPVVDVLATEAHRTVERQRRLSASPAADSWPTGACARCGRDLAGGVLAESVPVTQRWPVTAAHPGAARFDLARRHCSGCGAQLDTTVELRAT